MRETIEWGVLYDDGQIQPLYMELLARRIAAHRPEERTVVSRRIERVTGPWFIEEPAPRMDDVPPIEAASEITE